ncbi:MAG: ATP-binding protein [bacterium]
MNIYSYLPLIAVFGFFSLMVSIFFSISRKYFLTIPFILICLTTLIWQGSWTILFNIKNEKLLPLFIKIGYSGIIQTNYNSSSGHCAGESNKNRIDKFKKLLTDGVDLEINLQDNLPVIYGDSKELGNIIAEIGINAIESMDKKLQKKLIIKTKQIEVQSKMENRWNKYVQVEIGDTGCGIPEKDLGKIFNPLHTTKDKRIGLNLTIAHRVIEAHGGFIDVKTKLN